MDASRAQSMDFCRKVLDDQMDTIPTARGRLAAIGHRTTGRACRTAEQQPQVIEPGATFLNEQRRQMTLSQFRDALDAQRRRVLEYIEGLEEPAFERRKARIPLFKQFMGTDEITIDMYLGAMFDYHWNDHAGQLEKIRQAVGLGSDAAAKPGGVDA